MLFSISSDKSHMGQTVLGDIPLIDMEHSLTVASSNNVTLI